MPIIFIYFLYYVLYIPSYHLFVFASVCIFISSPVFPFLTIFFHSFFSEYIYCRPFFLSVSLHSLMYQ